MSELSTVTSPDESATGLRFGVLGPVRVWRGDTPVDIGPPQQRALLALLLASAGQQVGMAELVRLLWESPPASATNIVRKYLGALRRLLAPETRPPATRSGAGPLGIETESLDLKEFRQSAERVRAAAAAGRHGDAVTEFLSVLPLWRGRCAADAELSAAGRRVVAAIEQEFMCLLRDAADSALASGEAARVLDVLRCATANVPLDEGLHARLVRVLAATGDHAGALTAHRAICDRLDTDLAVEAGPELRDAYREVVRRLAASDLPPVPGPAVLAPLVPPAQLPADLATFVGRHAELDHLRALMADSPADSVLITAIDGMGGVGKTTLAVHLAHSVARRFPDGQLYVNLGGFSFAESKASTTQALRGFLEALGVPQQNVPDDVDAQAAMYRSVLAGRRVLVLLDNAHDLDQVRRLLPAGRGCMVIVTSRHSLAGLAAAHGAHTLCLEPFSTQEAWTALVRRLGSLRVAAELDAAKDILLRCAGLPLAIGIVAAQAALNPDLSLAAIAAAVWDDDSRLDILTGTDPATDIRSVFSSSYRRLSPAAARLFRLGSVHRGPDVPVVAAANVAGCTVALARVLLDELTAARLLTEYRQGRFVVHDLVGAYGLELANEVDGVAERRMARGRELDYYLHSCLRAVELRYPGQELPVLAQPRSGVTIEEFSGQAQAASWLVSERELLTAAVQNAVHNDFPSTATQLAGLLEVLDRHSDS